MDLRIIDIIKHALKPALINKRNIWSLFIILILINILCKEAITLLYGLFNPSKQAIFNMQVPLQYFSLYQIISTTIAAPFYTAIMIYSLHCTRNKNHRTTKKMGLLNFCSRYKTLGLAGALIGLLSTVMSLCCFLLFRLTGLNSLILSLLATMVFPSLVYAFTILCLPAIIDKQLPVIEALKFSCDTMRQNLNWLKLYLFYLALLFIIAVPFTLFGFGIADNSPIITLIAGALIATILTFLIPLMYMVNAAIYEHSTLA